MLIVSSTTTGAAGSGSRAWAAGTPAARRAAPAATATAARVSRWVRKERSDPRSGSAGSAKPAEEESDDAGDVDVLHRVPLARLRAVRIDVDAAHRAVVGDARSAVVADHRGPLDALVVDADRAGAVGGDAHRAVQGALTHAQPGDDHALVVVVDDLEAAGASGNLADRDRGGLPHAHRQGRLGHVRLVAHVVLDVRRGAETTVGADDQLAGGPVDARGVGD